MSSNNSESTPAQSPGNTTFDLSNRAAKVSIRHVSVAQLRKAAFLYEGALFRIEGKEFKKVIVIGNLIDRKKTDTQIAFLLDDGTGSIWARMWRDASVSKSDPLADLKPSGPEAELHFVRAFGELSQYGTQGRSLILYNVDSVQDSNEVTWHMLEIIKVTHLFRVGPPPLSITASSPSTAGSNLQQLRLQPKSPPAPELDTGDDEEINRPVHAIDANSVWETPAKVRKTRILAPPTPSSKRRERMMSDMHQDAEAGPSKVPARPISNETSVRREDIDRKILLVIREGMNILRRDRPGFEYNGVARNDIVDRIQELIPVLPNQVDKAIARLQQDGVICEMGEKQHFDLVD